VHEKTLPAAEFESFQKDIGPFDVAAETTRMAMVFTDAANPDHPIIFANDSFLSLTGYARESGGPLFRGPFFTRPNT